VIRLAQALEEVGRTAEADDLYLRIIRAGGPEQLVLLAKDRRTIIAQQTMRNRAPLRMDVASYLRGTIDNFHGLSSEEVPAIGIELAMLGQSGLDINNPNAHTHSAPSPATSAVSTCVPSCTLPSNTSHRSRTSGSTFQRNGT
jgi:hypothetical protein